MGRQLRGGIYYNPKLSNVRSKLLDKNHRSGQNKSFAVLFLRVAKGCSAINVGKSLEKLWKMYQHLKRGKVMDLPNTSLPPGGLSLLIGYGPKIFNLDDVKKSLPNDMKSRQFLDPHEGGGPILKGSGIIYGKDEHFNVGITEHIMIQFISDSQLAANRAIVETWKHLSFSEPEKEPLYLTNFYTGFQRDDGRSWLGFHDEVSNMRDAKEREKAVLIDVKNNNLQHKDYWTKGGFYLAFLRIGIDLNIWQKIDRKNQEFIVGRHKLSGCPLIGIDKSGNPIVEVSSSNHKPGLNPHNKVFRDHPDYFKKPVVGNKFEHLLDLDASFKILNQSHIGRTRHIDEIDSKHPTSRRIFRQSFEFLEPSNGDKGSPFRVGLNFMSFQNDPRRLFFILTDPNWMGNVNFGGPAEIQGMHNLVSVFAAGVFFVPRVQRPFPGASIFL